MAVRKSAAPSKTVGRLKAVSKKTNFSVRLPDEDVYRVKALAESHDWPMAKTIQKPVAAALDAKVLK
jgi:hypothetical protein